jgi:acyl-[acyl-carrier-protein] desaturase
MLGARFGMPWFLTCWAFEESRNGLVFREYLTRSGQRPESEFAAFEAGIFSKSWQPPYETSRRMACYGALQEGATYVAYKVQKDKARCDSDEVLEAIFHFVGRDEAAHAGFYRAMIELELSHDRMGTLDDMAYVPSTFKMPGDGLIPNYRERLRTSGAEISSRAFLDRVVSPLLTTLKIGRQELKQALRERSANSQCQSDLRDRHAVSDAG